MSTKCKGCGHTLKSAESIRRGYGPKCFKEATEDQQTAYRQFTERVNGAVSGINMEPVAAYIVSDEYLVALITEENYKHFRSQHPTEKLEVRVYADFITYQAENSDQQFTAVEMAHDTNQFYLIKNELRVRQQGVTPISVQEEMEMVV